MAGLFVGNMKTLGRDISVIGSDTFSGSTDMGNVSHVVPGIHAFVAIAGKEILLHSGEFATAAVSDRGVEGMLDAAKALAMTVVDLVADPDMLASVREEFEQSK
jgi:metal-dependent amidase/aminoacylase/carboxypeptidase family protein